MKRCVLTILGIAACALSLRAADPLSTEAKQDYDRVKMLLTKMAEAVPEADYGFQPTPEIRTFGQLMAHVADAQVRNCSTVLGSPQSGDAANKTAKADLVAALKASFEICDKAYGSLTDATASEMIPWRRGERSKLGALISNTIHDNEEYGYMAVYLRLKGIVPPSSAGR